MRQDMYTVVVVLNNEPWLFENKGTYNLVEALGIMMTEFSTLQEDLIRNSEYHESVHHEPLYDDYKYSMLEYMEGEDNLSMDLLVKKHGKDEYETVYSVMLLLERKNVYAIIKED